MAGLSAVDAGGVWAWLFLGAPLVVGVVLGAVFAKGWLSTYALFGVGLLLGFGVVLAAYLTSPRDQAHSNGTEGQQFLGRWWDPAVVIIVTALGYVLYLVGLGIGVFSRELIAVLRSGYRQRIRRSS